MIVLGTRITITTEGAGWNCLHWLARERKETAEETLRFLATEWTRFVPGLTPLERAEAVYQLVRED